MTTVNSEPPLMGARGETSPAPFVSVVIPNWNGAVHLPTCLSSLRRQTYGSFEVIVVDNGSEDDSLALLAREYPDVRVVALARNLGFAGGVNAGIRQAQGEIIALLNNDTETDPCWVEEMVAAFQRHPEAGMVASKILLFERRDTLHSAGDFYRQDGIPGNRGVWQQDSPEFNVEEPVFGPCGAAAGYRREMLDDVGLFEERLFAFVEDVDLAWRGQAAGWRCIYAPRSLVYHRLSATGGGVLASYYNGRNCLIVLARNYPGELLRKYAGKIVAAQGRIAFEALKAWRGAAARARLRGQLAGFWSLLRVRGERRVLQARRRVPVAYLDSLLTEVD